MFKKLFILLCHLNFIFAAQERGPKIYGYDSGAPWVKEAEALAIARAKEAYADLPKDERVVPTGPFGYEYWTTLSRFDRKQMGEYKSGEHTSCSTRDYLFGSGSVRYNGTSSAYPFDLGKIKGGHLEVECKFSTGAELLSHSDMAEVKRHLIERAEKERVLYQKHLQEHRNLIAQGKKVDETTITPSGMELDAHNEREAKKLQDAIRVRDERQKRNRLVKDRKKRADEVRLAVVPVAPIGRSPGRGAKRGRNTF